MANKKFKFYDLSDDNSFVENTEVENIEDNKKSISYLKPLQEEPSKTFLDEENSNLKDKLEKISKQTKEFEQTISSYEKEHKLNVSNKKNERNYLSEINSDELNDENNLSNFDSNKIESFFSYKQKLDVKTNIYLKHNLVSKIQDLSKKTGDSRSLIINKLIEIALKELELKK